MAKILSTSTGKLSIGDAFLIAGTKTLTEKFLAGYIGNATVFSGTVKLVGAVMVNKMLGGKWGDILGTALAVDGTEDVVNPLLKSGAIPFLNLGNSNNSVSVM
jgi:hypothetical protein